MIDSQETPGDSKEKESAAYLKRREQVRRAQRTHRERKEAYIKSLENEVLQLRTNESKIVQETRSLYTEISRLKALLNQHGIAYGNAQTYIAPSQLPNASSYSSSAEDVSLVSVVSNPQYHQPQLHLQSPQHGPAGKFYLSESDGSQSLGIPRAPRRKLSSFFKGRERSQTRSTEGSSDSGPPASTTNDIAVISATASGLNLRDVDQTNLGMEFVLTLEAPCLNHTQGSPDEHDSTTTRSPTGHALTTSAPLLFQSPIQPVPMFSPTTTSWPTASASLEKLLSLSSNIELSDEITPVQAWNQIRTHPNFDSLEIPNLKRLTQDLLGNVKCYGFGAVIEVEVFESLLRRLFWGSELEYATR